MVEGGGGGASFPVRFYDGEQEMNIGEVNIGPTLEYKPFQHMLSQKIGISPNQMSIYLVDRRKSPNRIPITGKVNFESIIARHKESSFLVVLKRSRKSRNRRERMVNGGFDYGHYPPGYEFSPPENMVLLRRDDRFPPIYDHRIPGGELAELNLRLRGLGPHHDFGLDLGFDPYLDRNVIVARNGLENKKKKVYCEECENKNAGASATASFHHCVNDDVVRGFVTRFGPISRPNLIKG